MSNDFTSVKEIPSFRYCALCTNRSNAKSFTLQTKYITAETSQEARADAIDAWCLHFVQFSVHFLKFPEQTL